MLCSIHHPPRPEADSPIIIFLRRGIPTATPNRSCAKSLSVAANATVVEMLYRLSRNDGYPSIIHNVGALDIVLKDVDFDGIFRSSQDMIGFERTLPVVTQPLKNRRSSPNLRKSVYAAS